ncbi:MAG: hypothetical protein K9L02_07990 [Acholeplasmataceae bacterium]|nr:hypothetical protein [Acholeplasmataceae bacterium]
MKKLKYSLQSKEVKYLIEKNPELLQLFQRKDEVIVNIDDDYFVSLVGTIVAQQLSGKVVQVIYGRLMNLFDLEINAQKIMSIPDESLRNIGLSYQKIKYLKSLSQCYIDKTIDFTQIEEMSNEEVIEMLVKIKGIGVWSAQMFLMFSLGREDVFSVLDLGLRNGAKKFFNQPDLTQEEILSISENWKPYRSIVSHYLWHAWDSK